MKFRASTTWRPLVALVCGLFPVASCGVAQEANGDASSTSLPPLVVTATRAAQPLGTLAMAVDQMDADALHAHPALALDDRLRSVPAFGLFRRTNSVMANPTAQGVSLRGIGPSGASRSLVLLDGVPLNDPFGGWVAWSKVPDLTLDRAEIVRGGGSGVWGNSALGGTVQLLSRRPDEDNRRDALTAQLGTRGLIRVEALAELPVHSNASLSLGGRWFQTSGDFQFSPDQRGAIDRPFATEHHLAHLAYSQNIGDRFRFDAGLRAFTEERDNGTPYQKNDSREFAARLGLAGEIRPGLALDVSAYAQRGSFGSTFSAVGATRATETPSLDQYDVPADAAGVALIVSHRAADGAGWTWGGDVRHVSGETRENFLFSNGAFLRRRFAGGNQTNAGLFVTHLRPLAPRLFAQISLRADRWEEGDRHRREIIRASGAVARNDVLARRRGSEISPQLGLTWGAESGWRARASAYRAFREPTLNELFRPFRVGNVATEANPALRPETLDGAEAGVEYRRGPWELSSGIFWSELSDAVTNVTLSVTPALTQRQRLNLDRVRARGVEAAAHWQARDGTIKLGLAWQYSEPTVRRAAVAPGLVGRRLAQVPLHTATVQWRWRPHPAWDFNAAARASSAQFEDDENTLRLAPAVTVDLIARWRISLRHVLEAGAENLLDARIETARATTGLTSIAAGRGLRIGWTTQW